MNKFINLEKQKGSGIFTIMVLIPVTLMMLVVVIDIGSYLLQQSRNQQAIDSNVLAQARTNIGSSEVSKVYDDTYKPIFASFFGVDINMPMRSKAVARRRDSIPVIVINPGVSKPCIGDGSLEFKIASLSLFEQIFAFTDIQPAVLAIPSSFVPISSGENDINFNHFSVLSDGTSNIRTSKFRNLVTNTNNGMYGDLDCLQDLITLSQNSNIDLFTSDFVENLNIVKNDPFLTSFSADNLRENLTIPLTLSVLSLSSVNTVNSTKVKSEDLLEGIISSIHLTREVGSSSVKRIIWLTRDITEFNDLVSLVNSNKVISNDRGRVDIVLALLDGAIVDEELSWGVVTKDNFNLYFRKFKNADTFRDNILRVESDTRPSVVIVK